ncbi:MAG: nitronate monooxygenase [Deltaproteobacteria bacterium]|nr:MAG: nitronate monooxygenase [Deltaproteobacteria bacterium]
MHSFSTPLSRRLGLKYPMVAAPMFIISNERMLLACAEAGILGAMPSLNGRTPEEFEAKLRWLRERTDRPFAINMTIGLTDPERLQADVELCERYEVPVWITSYGDPTEIVRRAHARKATVFHDVINLRHAKKAERAGVDAIIGVAAGAGGHAGRISPFALIPYLKDNLSVPVIAAGSISTGKQVLASLALGAELVYMGTRFIVAEECGSTDDYKEMVIQAGPEDIVYTDQVSGVHANFLKKSLPDSRPDGTAAQPKRWKDIWSAGHGVAEIRKRQTIEQIVDDLVREYYDTLAALPR